MTQVELFHQPAIVDGALHEPFEEAPPVRQKAGPALSSPERETEPPAAYEVLLADYAHASDEAIGLAQRRFRRELERAARTVEGGVAFGAVGARIEGDVAARWAQLALEQSEVAGGAAAEIAIPDYLEGLRQC